MVGSGSVTSAENARALALEKSVNEVRLVGRLSGVPLTRVLPSGDELTTWRIVVGRRPQASATERKAPTVDTIDCVAHKRAVRRLATKWTAGEVLEITGALRRRFWRGPSGAASRCEVEVVAAKKL